MLRRFLGGRDPPPMPPFPGEMGEHFRRRNGERERERERVRERRDSTSEASRVHRSTRTKGSMDKGRDKARKRGWKGCLRVPEERTAEVVRVDPNHKLPEEMLQEVLVRLGPKDIAQAARTCANMRRACQDDRMWEKKCMQEGIASNKIMALRREPGNHKEPEPTAVSWAECYRLYAHQKRIGKAMARKHAREAEERHEVGAKLTRCLASRELDHGQNGASFAKLMARARKKIKRTLHAIKHGIWDGKKSKGTERPHEETSCHGRPYTQVMKVPPAMKGKVHADFVLVNRFERPKHDASKDMESK